MPRCKFPPAEFTPQFRPCGLRETQSKISRLVVRPILLKIYSFDIWGRPIDNVHSFQTAAKRSRCPLTAFLGDGATEGNSRRESRAPSSRLALEKRVANGIPKANKRTDPLLLGIINYGNWHVYAADRIKPVGTANDVWRRKLGCSGAVSTCPKRGKLASSTDEGKFNGA